MSPRGLPWRTLALAAAVLAVAAAPGTFSALAFDRAAIPAGEPWRLLTGQLVHGSSYHLVWNVAALLGLGLLFERPLGGRGLTQVLLLSAALVGGGLWLLDPALSSYVGLSGVLNGLWVAGALAAARHESRRGSAALGRLYVLCVFAALSKIAAEAALARPLLTDEVRLGGVAVPLAHALGCLGGILWVTARHRHADGDSMGWSHSPDEPDTQHPQAAAKRPDLRPHRPRRPAPRPAAPARLPA